MGGRFLTDETRGGLPQEPEILDLQVNQNPPGSRGWVGLWDLGYRTPPRPQGGGHPFRLSVAPS